MEERSPFWASVVFPVCSRASWTLLPRPLCQKPTAPLATSPTGRLASLLSWTRFMNLLEYFKEKKKSSCAYLLTILIFKCCLEKLLFWDWERNRGLPWEGVSFPPITKGTEGSSERLGGRGAENLVPTLKSTRSISHCQSNF